MKSCEGVNMTKLEKETKYTLVYLSTVDNNIDNEPS